VTFKFCCYKFTLKNFETFSYISEHNNEFNKIVIAIKCFISMLCKKIINNVFKNSLYKTHLKICNKLA